MSKALATNESLRNESLTFKFAGKLKLMQMFWSSL
jgi:hypothetical protein